jgi:transposase-like protein
MGRHSKEFKERVISEAIEVGNVSAVARKHELSPNTLHSWVKCHAKGRGKPDDAVELKKLRSELKDAQLENAILKELLKKTNLVWLKESR